MKEGLQSQPEAPYWERDFVGQAAREMAVSLARYSVDPESVRNIKIPQNLKLTDQRIAEELAKVNILDENLQKLDFSTDQGVFNAGLVTHAKALASLEATFDTKFKSRLQLFADKAIDIAGQAISKLDKKRGLAAASGLVILATACNSPVSPTQVVTSDGSPNATIEVRPTSTPEIIPTATYVAPNSGETGLNFPTTIDQVAVANPFDSFHVSLGADKLATATEQAVNADFGAGAGETMTYLEVAGQGKVGGMIGIYHDGNKQVDWTVWTTDANGNYTYLGRKGLGFGYAPVYWEKQDSLYVGFIITPQGRQDIFQSQDGKTISGFLPLGETKTIDLKPTAGEAKTLTILPIPADMVTLLKEKGTVDWTKGVAYDSAGKEQFLFENGSWHPEYKGLAIYTVEEARQLIVNTGSMTLEDRKLGIDHHIELEKHANISYNGRGAYIFSYKGLNEALLFNQQPAKIWNNNRVRIDNKSVDSTFYVVDGLQSNHTVIIFKDSNENTVIILLDGLIPRNNVGL